MVTTWTALFVPQDLNPGASILETQQWLHRHRFSSYCRVLANFTGEAGVRQGPYLRGLRAGRLPVAWLAVCSSANFSLGLRVARHYACLALFSCITPYNLYTTHADGAQRG